VVVVVVALAVVVVVALAVVDVVAPVVAVVALVATVSVAAAGVVSAAAATVAADDPDDAAMAPVSIRTARALVAPVTWRARRAGCGRRRRGAEGVVVGSESMPR
jgi:hypothetical protein